MLKQKSPVKIVLVGVGCILTVVLAILALFPFLTERFAVEVTKNEVPTVTEAPLPDAPKEVPVTVYYVMEDASKKISAIYIEVFPVGGNVVYYMEVPVDTKVNLSEELYKSLQTYAPELPQYLKLSNMAEGFSMEYSLNGCNRILSEVLGVSLTEYIRTDAESLEEWWLLQTDGVTSVQFFEGYTKWLEQSSSSRTTEERWMYYESLRKATELVHEKAPGSQEKDGYLISGKRSKERLEEIIIRKQITVN